MRALALLAVEVALEALMVAFAFMFTFAFTLQHPSLCPLLGSASMAKRGVAMRLDAPWPGGLDDFDVVRRFAAIEEQGEMQKEQALVEQDVVNDMSQPTPLEMGMDSE